MIIPRFFTAIGTVPHAERLAFLTQDVRAAGTVFGFYGAAAAIGARPSEIVLLVARRQRAEMAGRQIVLVFQQDEGFSTALAKLYRARGRPIGFEAQRRWCAIPEEAFLADETFAMLAARFPTLMLVEEAAKAGESAAISVLASGGFRRRPALKLAPLPPRKTAPKPPAPEREAANVVPLPVRPKPAAAAAPSRPVPLPQPLPPRRRRLRSAVALNEQVERRVVNEFRRLLEVVAYYG